MRKTRNSLINKAPKAKSTVPLKEALQAREANLLGNNGPLHGQDRYLAQAQSGDLVIPINELSPDLRKQLEDRIGDFKTRLMGQGGELPVSEQFTDGLGLAEMSDIPELLILGARVHSEVANAELKFELDHFQSQIEYYLENRKTHQIFIHRREGHLQGALFAELCERILSCNPIVLSPFFYVQPEYYSSVIVEKMLKALGTWAITLNASEIHMEIMLDSYQGLIKSYNYKAFENIYRKHV